MPAVADQQGEGLVDGSGAREDVDLALRVAGDVGNRRSAGRLLIEPVDRHDREDLIDPPGVDERLEEAEVREVEIAELVEAASRFYDREMQRYEED